MSRPAIISGAYVDCRFMPGLKSARISIDIPIEHSNEFLKMFGAPDRVAPVHVAIARLNGADVPAKPEDDAEPVKAKPLRSNLAAILIKENKDFQVWLVDRYWNGKEEVGDYDALLKRVLQIASKKELDADDAAAERFDRLSTDFAYRNVVRS